MVGNRIQGGDWDGRGMRIAIVVTRFNEDIASGLLRGAVAALAEAGNQPLTTCHVPGAWELPLAAQWLARHEQPDAIVALGAVIRGDTAHFDYISEQCSAGLGRVSLDHNIPVCFGVLTCDDLEQARRRSADDEHNKGREAAQAAIEMVALGRDLET